jgi:hypothetical protein
VVRPGIIGKKMVASFFLTSIHMATIMLETQHIVTAQWYRAICQTKVT